MNDEYIKKFIKLCAKLCKKKEDYVNLILSADSDGEDDEEEEPPALEGMEPV